MKLLLDEDLDVKLRFRFGPLHETTRAVVEQCLPTVFSVNPLGNLLSKHGRAILQQRQHLRITRQPSNP